MKARRQISEVRRPDPCVVASLSDRIIPIPLSKGIPRSVTWGRDHVDVLPLRGKGGRKQAPAPLGHGKWITPAPWAWGRTWAPGHLNALRPIRYQDELAPLLPACALDRLPPWGCELGGASGRLVLTGAIGLRRRANRRMTMAFKIRPAGTQTVPFTGTSRILETRRLPVGKVEYEQQKHRYGND
jgi:hypothetical protein